MTQWLRQYGMTPGRAAIMAVLAIALIAVWGPLLLPSGNKSKPAVAVAKPRTSDVASAATRPSSPAPTQARRPTSTAPTPTVLKPTAKVMPVVADEIKPGRPLPKFTASEAGAHDPFAAPAWAPATVTLAAGSAGGVATGNVSQRFAAIRSRGVAMILVSPDGKAAQLGDRTVRVGDQVDGFEVIDITADGVVFMPAASGNAEGVDGA